MCKRRIKNGLFLAFSTLLVNLATAQTAQPAKHENPGLWSNNLFLLLFAVMVLLLLVIIAMAEVVKAGAVQERLRQKKEAEKNEAEKKAPAKVVATLFFLLVASYAFGQEAAPAAPVAAPEAFNYWGLGTSTFYLMLSVIVFEVFVVLMLFRSGMMLLGVKKTVALKEEPSLLERMNASVSVEEEHAILMDHDYDGIRELDNDLPPWWKYGFIATIIFAVVYLLHFHVFHTGKSSAEEYDAQVKEGEEQVAEYKKTAPNLVDESNVTLLTDAASLAAGKDIFKQNCSPCHGENGQGIVGPNFTDDYWLHGGSIHDVFKSIKYGWQDKGMKSWQTDLRPEQIQQVASYVKSLRGTNPPNQKEKQGDFYSETGTKPPADSVKADSVKTQMPDSAKAK